MTEALDKLVDQRNTLVDVLTGLHARTYLWDEVKKKAVEQYNNEYLVFFEDYLEFIREVDDERSKIKWQSIYNKFLRGDDLNIGPDIKKKCSEVNAVEFNQDNAKQMLESVIDEGFHKDSMFVNAFKGWVKPILKDDATIANLEEKEMLKNDFGKILEEVSRSIKGQSKTISKTIEDKKHHPTYFKRRYFYS